MKRLLISLTLLVGSACALAACPVPVQNTPSAAAKALAISKLGPLLACQANDPLNDQSPCNTFASRGLSDIYGVTDFKTGANSHKSANQIHAAIKSSSSWKEIGPVLNDDNALCAQSAANAGMPVVAVSTGAVHGHIALVIPGEPEKSGSWGKLVPNSASFFYGNPKSSYVNGPLSKAWTAADASNVNFYYRMTSK